MAGQESNVSTVQDGWRVSTLRALFTAHQVPRLAGLLDGQMDVFRWLSLGWFECFDSEGTFFVHPWLEEIGTAVCVALHKPVQNRKEEQIVNATAPQSQDENFEVGIPHNLVGTSNGVGKKELVEVGLQAPSVAAHV